MAVFELLSFNRSCFQLQFQSSNMARPTYDPNLHFVINVLVDNTILINIIMIIKITVRLAQQLLNQFRFSDIGI